MLTLASLPGGFRAISPAGGDRRSARRIYGNGEAGAASGHHQAGPRTGNRCGLLSVVLQLLLLPVAVGLPQEPAEPAPQVSGEAATESGHAFDLRVPVVLEKELGAQRYRADVDLGTLPSGTKGRIVLVISNPTPYEIRFSETTGFCACTGIKASSMVIAPHGQITVEVLLKVHLLANEPEGMISFMFRDSDMQTEIRVMARHRISGLLQFHDTAVSLRVPYGESTGQVRMPLLFTEPVRLENLRIEPSDALRDVVFGIEGDGQSPHRAYVVANISVQGLAGGDFAGELTIRDPVTGRRSVAMIAAVKGQPLDVRPPTVWLRPVAGEGEGVYQGSAMLLVRVGETRGIQKQADRKEAARAVEYEFGGACEDLPSLEITPVRLNGTTCRMVCTLRLSPDELSSLRNGKLAREGKIRWAASGNGDRWETAGDFLIMDR